MDSNTSPDVRCEQCGTDLPATAAAHVWRDRVVCVGCRVQLERRRASRRRSTRTLLLTVLCCVGVAGMLIGASSLHGRLAGPSVRADPGPAAMGVPDAVAVVPAPSRLPASAPATRLAVLPTGATTAPTARNHTREELLGLPPSPTPSRPATLPTLRTLDELLRLGGGRPSGESTTPNPAVVQGCYVVELSGTVGREITGDYVRRSAAAARRAGASRLVLDIDSGGGLIGVQAEISETIAGTRDMEVVAYVRRAHSAAAIIALSCPTIVMAPGGQIGAAVPYSVATGVPEPLRAKALSALLAGQRASAERAGHSPLFVTAMADADAQVWAVDRDGNSTLSDAPAPGAWLVKRSGSVMTLTAGEARKFGLSCGTADGCDSAADWVRDRPAMRLVGSARPAPAQPAGPAVDSAAIDAAFAKIREDVARARQAEAAKAEERARRAALDNRLNELEESLYRVRALGQAAEDSLSQMQARCRREQADARADYDRTVGGQTGQLGPGTLERAESIRERRIAFLDSYHLSLQQPVKDRINFLNREQERLIDRREQLLSQ